MELRTARHLIWLALLLLLPLPMFAGAVDAFVPVGRMLLLTTLCILVLVVEGTQGVAGLLALMMGSQAVVWTAVLFIAAVVLSVLINLPFDRPSVGVHNKIAAGRGSRAESDQVFGIVVVVLILLSALICLMVPVYRTPFSANSLQSTLLELYR